jgi:hypothetical protein
MSKNWEGEDGMEKDDEGCEVFGVMVRVRVIQLT